MSTQLTKQEHIANYIRTMAQIEASIKPYQQQRKDFKQNYKDNSWLTSEEIKLADKAYSLIKQEVDFENLAVVQEEIMKALGLGDGNDDSEED